MKNSSDFDLFERLVGYFFLGLFGTIGIVAVILAPILVVIKMMDTPLINFVIGGSVLAVVLTLGYLYSCVLNYLERKSAEKYRKQYEKEQAEMARNWINRGVTTVESPYIPDGDVQALVAEFAEHNNQRNNTTFDFQSVAEYLEGKDRETGENRHQVLMDFMTKYELKLGDTINYWW